MRRARRRSILLINVDTFFIFGLDHPRRRYCAPAGHVDPQIARHGGRDEMPSFIVWDENNYSTAPNSNQVLLIVDTNYGVHGVQSGTRYTHFSLLRSLEAGFGLPCLNHACDANVQVMTDLFGTRP
jgi:hypothetical protein